jgi:hypothetical protein
LRLRFTGSLGLDYNKEVFATFAYGKYNGTERIVGSVSGYPLLARLSNADAFDIEGGLRYYLRPEGPIRTYVAGAAGLRFLQATDVTFRVVEVGLTLANLPYFKGSALFIFGGDAVSATTYPTRSRWAWSSGCGTKANRAPKPLFADPKLRASTTRAAAGRFRSASSPKRGSDAGTQQPSPVHRSAWNDETATAFVRPRSGIARRASLEWSVWAAPGSPEQASPLPTLPQVARDVASPSAQVRRKALRGLRERGGPETLPLLAGLLGDAEIDIREGAIAGVIGVYVQPRANRSTHQRGFGVRGRAVPWPAMVGPS